MKIVTRKEAVEAGLTRYFTGKPCRNGHLFERQVSNLTCVICLRITHKRTTRKTPEQRKARNKYQREWRRSTTVGKITDNLRHRLNRTLRGSYRAGSAVRDLGCSVDEFRSYIEKKFLDGMTWTNWGKWHLDHIQPLSLFNLSDRKQFLIACHYSNYQPLWAVDNIRKGNREDWTQ